MTPQVGGTIGPNGELIPPITHSEDSNSSPSGGGGSMHSDTPSSLNCGVSGGSPVMSSALGGGGGGGVSPGCLPSSQLPLSLQTLPTAPGSVDSSSMTNTSVLYHHQIQHCHQVLQYANGLHQQQQQQQQQQQLSRGGVSGTSGVGGMSSRSILQYNGDD